jgi:hypothetical protein
MEFIDNGRWVVHTGEDASWTCEHVDSKGNSMPGTLLNLRAAEGEWSDATQDKRRYRIVCPDCGTWWRVWPYGRIAQYYAAPPQGVKLVEAHYPEYHRPDQKDIDRIIEQVKLAMPESVVEQCAAYVPSQSDDGIWWFSLPSAARDIQIDSSSGMCPFLAETEDWSSHKARRFSSIEEAVGGILAYLAGCV